MRTGRRSDDTAPDGELPADPTAVVRATYAVLFATCALALVACDGKIGPGRPSAPVCGALTQLLTGLLCAWAARKNIRRPLARTGWGLLALAHMVCAPIRPALLLALAPSTADEFLPLTAVLVHGPAALVALWLLARDAVPQWARSAWWDAAVTGSCTAALGLTVTLRLGTSQTTGTTDLLWSIGCASLMASVVAVLTLTGAPVGPVLAGLVAGTLLVSCGEFLVKCTIGPTGSDWWGVPRLVPLAGHVLVGLAALASITERPTRDRRARSGQGLRTILLPWAACLAGLVLLGVAGVSHTVPGAAVLLALMGIGTYLGLVGTAAGRRGVLGPGLSWLPGTDELTGLVDRRELARILTGGTRPSARRRRAQEPEHVWLLLADLDRFQEINDALGHEAGDLVLTEASRRFRTTLREGQVLARLGADEFAVLLPGVGKESAVRVARSLRQVLVEPIEVAGQRLHVRASVGAAGCALRPGDTEDLLRQVAVAVRRAKRTGRGIEVYDAARDRPDAARLRRIDELRGALAHGGLEVFLQPQVDLSHGTVVGVEALARWRHPQDGVLLPDSFLPLAAQIGLMRPVTALMLDGSLAACARWWPERKVPVSVNLSVDDLQDPDLPQLVQRCLGEHGLPPAALRVEITEEALVPDPAAAAGLLEEWRNSGITVALDDYGTGYSSLAHLHELPLDCLKLDRVFICDLDHQRTATIVRHTIAMAHGLGLRVVAEGVEDRPTARRLADVGCDTAQGLYFGPATDLPTFLHRLASERPG